MPSRKGRGAGSKPSYDAFRASLSRRRQEEPEQAITRRRVASAIVATCTGSARLSDRIGMQVSFVGITHDVAGTLAALRRSGHGSCEAPLEAGEPFAHCDGWDDWRLTHLSTNMLRTTGLVRETAIARDVISFEHRRSTPLAALRRSVGLALAPMRLHEAATDGAALARRKRGGDPLRGIPRYTPSGPPLLRCVRADDIYVFDPWEGIGRLSGLIASAVAQADLDHSPGRGWRPR